MKKSIIENPFEHNYRIALESESKVQLIKQYEKYETDNKNKFLMRLYIKILAYDSAIKMLAWKEYPKKNLQSKSIIGNVKSNIEYFGEENVEHAKQEVNKNFRSSFDNKYSRKIKRLNETAAYMRIVPVYKNPQLEKLLNLNDPPPFSLLDDFQQLWLTSSVYLDKRMEQAKLLQKEFCLSNNDVAILQKTIFQEITTLIKKYHNLLNTYAKSFTPNDIKTVIIYLEQFLMYYVPIFLKDLGIKDILSLEDVYQVQQPSFVTICYYCGKPMARITKSHCCTRHENRWCYLRQAKDQKKEPFPRVLERTHNKCDVCKKHSSLNFIRNLGGQKMQFCSNRCLRTMQQRVQRYKKSM